jgi:hypothetical protein
MMMSLAHWRRLGPVGSMLLLVAALPAFAHAAASTATAAPARPAAFARLWSALPHTGPHFLYVDNGHPVSNSLSGYQITPQGLVPTPGSPYPTGGQFNGGAAGTNQIATAVANGPCLFHTDQQLMVDEGQVESFRVNPTTGVLTAVSIVHLPGTYSQAGDIHVSADGRAVYVASWADVFLGVNYLHTLTVGAGCTLTLAQSLHLATAAYFSIALVGADGLLGVNTDGGTLDLYRITHGTQLTLVSSTPSQVSYPLGAAAGPVGATSYTFTGSGSAYQASAVEAHTVNGQGRLGPVPGSPAVDSSATQGADVLFDPLHQQVIESQQMSGTLGIFGISGGRLAFLSQVAVVDGTFPGPMVELGSVVFVANGTVDACLLKSGVARCMLAVVLPDNIYARQGIGVI